MANNYMADVGALTGLTSTTTPNSTSRPNNTELNMEDFLTLMIVQLQNQTIDDTMDTSEMMNQLVQMQMISALTNMTDASLMTYASSLVGKEVTIGAYGSKGLEEKVITVIGTGYSNGEQVIFGSDGNTYALSQIMAVGRLPDQDSAEPSGSAGAESVDPVGGAEGPEEPKEDEEEVTEPVDPPVDEADETQGAQGDTEYEGELGAPIDPVG